MFNLKKQHLFYFSSRKHNSFRIISLLFFFKTQHNLDYIFINLSWSNHFPYFIKFLLCLWYFISWNFSCLTLSIQYIVISESIQPFGIQVKKDLLHMCIQGALHRVIQLALTDLANFMSLVFAMAMHKISLETRIFIRESYTNEFESFCEWRWSQMNFLYWSFKIPTYLLTYLPISISGE